MMRTFTMSLALLAFVVQVMLTSGSLMRKNVETLSPTEVSALQNHLHALEEDHTVTGFETLAGYHGEPSGCMDGDHPIACCVHGEATFPQWHRLYVVQFEQLLVMKGLTGIGVPYWDWTQPLEHLPELVEHQIFIDPNGGLGRKNAWFSTDINIGDLHTHTARAVDERLFENVGPGGKTHLFETILDALEFDDYCQFEVQLEVAHNHIHYLVGGRHKHSMSTLEYTSYDPIFFLHHSNVDRIFAIWQELQKKRGKPYDHADCSVELFNKDLHPFDRDENPIELTKTFSKSKDLFSYLQLGYTYDDLKLNGMSIDQLHSLLEQRHARERAFAVFSLHGLGISANVKVQVCNVHGEKSTHCEFAGDFFVLGGANEMNWEFNYPFYYDISHAVQHLGQPLDGMYTVRADVYSVNGTFLGSDILPKPYGSYRVPKGHTDPPIDHDHHEPTAVVRKDVDVLTDEEVYHLRQAMARFMNDTSIDGFQAVAEFHGLPAKCPHPDAAVRYACCVHGMPTFPHWHRLFVVEVEDELRSRGLDIGIPYWDWTKPHAHIPALADDESYEDPVTHQPVHNPFHDGKIGFLGQETTRDVQSTLDEGPVIGDHTSLFDGMLLAFEQTDFCDFEVQFEVIHNSPHFMVGGFAPYSLATLHYSAFDPIFYLHHSTVDRQWAIWQQLQIRRGLPYKAHCANTMTHELLKPFGFPPPFNNDEKTFDNARPTNIYDYEHVLDYRYDTLTFGGMTVDQLYHYLEERNTHDRAFVGIHLHNIGVSASVDVRLQVIGGESYSVGKIAVLGGVKEMPWRFDRLFKLEITDALARLGLSYDDDFEVHLNIVDIDSGDWPEDTFSHSNIIHVPAETDHDDQHYADRMRADVESLSKEQIQNLRDALNELEQDETSHGFAHIAAFHGEPNWCPSPDAETKYACCVHGMATFPHWHRLLTVQAENALAEHGLKGGLPYWDWTLPMTHLPDLVQEEFYIHPKTGESTPNAWHHSVVEGHATTRDVRSELFEPHEFGHMTSIAEHVMLAFEQTNFCDFEIQFEVAHNYIHALVGGNHDYSMASLRFTAYDPLFFLHHSNTDRLWAIWQALQKYRGLPYNTANCAIASMRKPLQPFAQTSVVNPDAVTRDHSTPFDVFDYKNSFHYHYDNFQFNGLSVPQLQREIIKRQADDRVFAGFMLHGIYKSALVTFDICKPDDSCHKAGEFYLLGDAYEMPWEFDRLFKYEITHELEDFGLKPTDKYTIKYTVLDLHGNSLGHDAFGIPTTIYEAGHGHAVEAHRDDYMTTVTASSHVRQNLEDLTEGEMESLRAALHKMEEDGSFNAIARFHGYPGLCEHDGDPAACCVHGGPTFPHWHRLYVEQVENALLNHGSAVSVPYWDWTKPIRELPHLFDDAHYFDSRTLTEESNPFFKWKIDDTDHYTTRDPRPELFNSDYLLDNVLLALEQTSYCDFEIQFEIVHNAIHSWVGGRGLYSLSSLDYSAFDPVFFLHHANVDRIWAIWQALQKYRGLSFEESDCALNLMRQQLHPFDDKTQNIFELTSKYSRPVDVFDYSHHFDYHYDTLNFNSWTIPQLEEVLQNHRSHDRLFAGFMLHNIGTSADVEIYVCVSTGKGKDDKNCDHLAGTFAILGGKYEMPFVFDRLYKFEISNAVRKLGLRLDSAADFDLEIKIHAFNGSYLDPHILHEPSIIFEPGDHNHQDEHGHSERHLVRKNVKLLSPAERRSLVLAMRSLQADSSADGFQSLASFHALPPLCPYPEATERFACCVHGMATFPQWHRLYTVQFEDALRRHGATVGIPYWDTVVQQKEVPHFIADETWDDPLFHENFTNPWHGAHIEFDDSDVHREVNMEQLSKDGPHGYDTWSWKQYVFALEQEDYCDFEVQFEVAHNAIHAWMGGHFEHSMAHLHFASYDPVFVLHHSMTDRIFAIWQELQKFRGHDPNEINCALELMDEPLKPFSFGAPYNLNPTTKEYSKPEDAFDYQGHFHYEYDTLELQGMDVQRLQGYIDMQQEHDRVFAGFLLKGIGLSAHVQFDVCTNADHDCHDAGFFDILGGSAEMPWGFDRLYKYEITDCLEHHHLDVHDAFHIEVHITAQNGTELSSSLIPEPSVIFKPHQEKKHLHDVAPNRVRRDLTRLSDRDIQSLKAAFRDLQEDDGADGYQAIAGFHGAPGLCPDEEGHKYACCIHGMPTFPHWHRLYTVEMEDALIRHGASSALPYWDWTRPIDRLPELFTSESFYDAWKDEVVVNSIARGYIKSVDGYTVRDPRPELYKLSHDGHHSVLWDEVLLALEQTDYCDFEVQFELVHNAMHYLIGGRQLYSLATLDYSSYDPIFFVHHSFVDKIWAIWQELQKHRGLPHERADCAVNFMNEKMHPFDWESFNPDVRTREHAVPKTVFDYEDLGYHYDNFELGGNTLEEIEELIHEHKSHPRVFAGFSLHGIGTSADVVFSICTTPSSCVRAGGIFILGGKLEMPWHFDRLVKYDITHALHDAHIKPEDVFNAEAPFFMKYEIHAVNGTALPPSSITAPTLIYQPAEKAVDHQDDHAHGTGGVGVRKNIHTLTTEEKKNLRDALHRIQEGNAPMSFDSVAKAHGWPAQCTLDGHEVACCHHGMASFPQWHRLFTRQMELALTFAGAHVGIPYWDWTEAFTELPALVADDHDNPFHHHHIPGTDHETSRAPRPQLFKDPEHGEESFFYRQALLAFEQRDYCDFEVQFEVLHNNIHSWVGGQSPYGLSTLEYSAYDPLFYIHHSNVDRIFAIWQALQKYRGLDYNTANCNIQELRRPLEPFNHDDNPIMVTREHAHAVDAFNYDQFGYQYDNLNFHGLTIPELERMLEEDEEQDHVFANFLLHGFQSSADVEFDLCDDHFHDDKDHCAFAGTFAVLGGPLEMPWKFDRLFKYDVTNVFLQMRLRPDSEYHFRIRVTAVNGTELDPHLLDAPSVSFVPGRKHGYHDDDHHDDHHEHVASHSDELTRYEVSHLSLEQVSNLRNALHKLQNDHGPNGYEAIAGFHGSPGRCPENATEHFACCRHGMPAFPHWHRLLTVQFEHALKEKGAKVGVPYWDWTRPSKALPSLFTDPFDNNPFRTYRMTFNDQYTQRDVQEELFIHPSEKDLRSLFHQALETLEESNYCDFEVQYEILHNAVHEMVGGHQKYGMSTLGYSAYDPFFMVHHASIDRIWVIWQSLQKLRHKPFNYAKCANRDLSHALEPFSYGSVNLDEVTRHHSMPLMAFDHKKFHYHYENLELNGHSVEELHEMIQEMKASSRLFAGFVLSGFGTSAHVQVNIVKDDNTRMDAGSFYVLGGQGEMPWAYERIYKMDITDSATKLGPPGTSHFHFDLNVTQYDGTHLDVKFPVPLIIKRAAHSDHDIVILPLKRDNELPPKIVVPRGTTIMFHAVEDGVDGPMRELGSFTSSEHCDIPPGTASSYELDVAYSLMPGDYYFVHNMESKCKKGYRIQISVDVE